MRRSTPPRGCVPDSLQVLTLKTEFDSIAGQDDEIRIRIAEHVGEPIVGGARAYVVLLVVLQGSEIV